MKKTLLFLCLSLFMYAGQSVSVVQNPLVEKALAADLDQHPTWLKLLYFDELLGRSEVLSDNFFLDAEGRFDPRKELIQTLNLYTSIPSDNTSARCRFPARYLWLDSQLNLPNFEFRQKNCDHLERWALFDEVTSISAIMVSGYFGNPASTFGHSLLKFNSDTASRFLDLTFNYGALVPDNEPILRYIYKGIVGGYEAGFSDGYYFSQDRVYSRTEFRDMWDYELNLTEFDRNLLIAHLWEVSGKKFDYLFLNKNCAFRLAEVLELVEESSFLTQRSRLWYAPVELFNRIEQVNEEKDGEYIRSVQFIPSYQREVLERLNLFDDTEKGAFKSLMLDPNADLSAFHVEQQIKLLNALLHYFEYKDVGLMDASNNHYKELKRQAMLRRMLLPVQADQTIKIKPLPSPLESSPPMMFGFGMSESQSEHLPSGLAFRWSPFFYDALSLNSLQGGELVVLDTTLLLDKDKERLSFDRVDLIRVKKMPNFLSRGILEPEWAWTVRLAIKRSKTGKVTPFFSAGLFDGLANDSGFLLWGIRGEAMDNESSWLTLFPYVELGFQASSLKGLVNLSRGYDVQEKNWVNTARFDLNYNFNTRTSFRFEYAYDESSNFRFYIQRYI
ncbi:DUF4105 domain-containing protein [Thiomicrospira microaerophila]|uniref:Lnb N-terminal periplasmic domain-containing protein n=1 Tax=Thiomicrospira microaerophila TaxID=406020 RepID=UPI00200DC84F|nr:DUF4105 domain-containing protein [Thiomicrospira microaerophila]UQB43009.1 DUF4105 domain-containing protein [Thiomicrospira microaerophila]